MANQIPTVSEGKAGLHQSPRKLVYTQIKLAILYGSEGWSTFLTLPSHRKAEEEMKTWGSSQGGTKSSKVVDTIDFTSPFIKQIPPIKAYPC